MCTVCMLSVTLNILSWTHNFSKGHLTTETYYRMVTFEWISTVCMLSVTLNILSSTHLCVCANADESCHARMHKSRHLCITNVNELCHTYMTYHVYTKMWMDTKMWMSRIYKWVKSHNSPRVNKCVPRKTKNNTLPRTNENTTRVQKCAFPQEQKNLCVFCREMCIPRKSKSNTLPRAPKNNTFV